MTLVNSEEMIPIIFIKMVGSHFRSQTTMHEEHRLFRVSDHFARKSEASPCKYRLLSEFLQLPVVALQLSVVKKLIDCDTDNPSQQSSILQSCIHR